MSDISDYEYASFLSFKQMYDDMTDEERAAYWKKENTRENLSWINSLNESIQTDKRIIKDTQRWLKHLTEDYTNSVAEPTPEETQTLRDRLVLGAELIEACEQDIIELRKEIVNYTKYPMHSQKRRDWYQTKEGKQWQEKILRQLKKN